MSDIERDLREALRAQEPPVGFAARVMARSTAQRGGRGWFAWPRWVPVAAAACLLGTFGIVRLDQQRRGEEAKRQLMLALEITAEKVHFAEQKVQRLQIWE